MAKIIRKNAVKRKRGYWYYVDIEGNVCMAKIESRKEATKKKAMRLVNKKCFNNKCEDVSKRGIGADLQYGEKAFIEVKGQSNSYPVAFRIYDTALEKINSRKYKYYVYIVFNIRKKPKLLILGKNIIGKHMRKSNQKGCQNVLGIKTIIKKYNLKFKDL